MSIFDILKTNTPLSGVTGEKTMTIIGENCVIEGDITFDKTIEINGRIKGSVNIAENCTNAKLIVRKSGVVEGDVNGSDVVIEGEVIGNVASKVKITVEASAFISGNLYYDLLDMKGGATVNGNLIRNQGKEPQKLENKPAVTINNTDKDKTSNKLL